VTAARVPMNTPLKSAPTDPPIFEEAMASPDTAHAHHPIDAPVDSHAEDALDAIVPVIPIVLPVVGGVLMFLLAFIAIYMA
jgi:hypothetical protein